MTIAANRARARSGRAAPSQPRRVADAVPLPDAVGRALRLRRLRRLPRRRARAGALRRAPGRGGGRARGRSSRRRRARLCRRALDLEHGLHHARSSSADERRPAEVGERGGLLDRRSRRSAAITVRTATTPQGQGHRTVIAQVVADRARRRARRTSRSIAEVDTSTSPWTIASGNYSSRFSGVGVGAAVVAAERLAEKIAAIRTTSATRARPSAASPGPRTGTRSRCPRGWSPGSRSTAYYAAPNLLPPDDEDRIASSASHGFVADVAVVEIDRETGEVDVLDYVTVHDAGRLLNPLLAEGQVRGGLAHGAAAALFERHVYDEDGNLLTGSFMDYLVPTAPDLPTPKIGHREIADAVPPARREGPRRGNDDERARRDRECGRRRPRPRRCRAAVHAGARVGAAPA